MQLGVVFLGGGGYQALSHYSYSWVVVVYNPLIYKGCTALQFVKDYKAMFKALSKINLSETY